MSRMKSSHSWCAVPAVFLLSVPLWWWGLVSRATAAEPPAKSYRELPVQDKLQGNHSKVTSMLRRGEFLAELGGQETVDNYYKLYALPRWTLADNRTMLPTFRKELAGELKSAKFEPGKPNRVYAHIRDNLILAYLRNFARPWAPPAQEFSPAVRVNAMLMIGELNEAEPATTTELPKPLAAAVPVLREAVEDASQLDAVKIAALDGLLRHVRLGGARDRDEGPRLLKAMLNLVDTPAPPQGRTADGHAWMRSLAADFLGELKWAGSNGEVIKSLAKMVAESDSPLSSRCAAARALGRLNLQGVSGLNPSDIARGLGGLAVDACKAESEPISRRRLKDRLTAVWLGLTGREWNPDQTSVAGIAGLATAPPHQAFVAGVRQALENVLKPFDDRSKLDDVALTTKVQETSAALEQAVKK